MEEIKKMDGNIIANLINHWDYTKSKITMEDINKYNEEQKESEGYYLFDESELKWIEDNLDGWEIYAGTDGYHNHDGQVCDYEIVLFKDGVQYIYSEEHSLVTGWFIEGETDFYVVDPTILSEEDKLKMLVGKFHELAGFCDELNIYEHEEMDKDMQEAKTWVEENFDR